MKYHFFSPVHIYQQYFAKEGSHKEVSQAIIRTHQCVPVPELRTRVLQFSGPGLVPDPGFVSGIDLVSPMILTWNIMSHFLMTTFLLKRAAGENFWFFYPLPIFL